MKIAIPTSRAGSGSTRLPRCSKFPAPETATRVESPDTEDHRHILLVDDDPTVRGSLKEVLLGEHYSVFAADNGQEALNRARSAPVDLVLLDLNMPVKNGWDTFEELSREHPLIPIIIATARPNQLFTALNAGVGALVEKPMDIPQLLETIRSLLSETPEQRLARLVGENTEFHYQPPPA